MKHALTLLTAPLDGFSAAPPTGTDRLPVFSWERVPRYMHVRKDTAFTSEEIRYLATFPLVTFERHSYFCAHDGYDAKRSKVWMTHPLEFDRPLGAPTGPATRAGPVYTRDFAHAPVRLDIESKTAEIHWR